MVSLARAKHLQTATGVSNQAHKSSSSSGGVLDEDLKIVAFINRLDEKMNQTPTAENISSAENPVLKPSTSLNDNIINTTTVPVALSRRILNKQGVDFTPESNIDAVLSFAGDRFIASVLQQAILCRSHRLEGEALLRKEHLARKKLKRKLRAEKIEVAITKRNEWKAKVNTAELTLKNLESPPISSAASIGSKTAKSKKKQKKEKSDEKSVGASKKAAKELAKSPAPDDEDTEKEDDKTEINFSDSEWAEWGDGSQLETVSSDEESDEEEYMTIQLQDVVHSVRSYGLDLTGKIE